MNNRQKIAVVTLLTLAAMISSGNPILTGGVCVAIIAITITAYKLTKPPKYPYRYDINNLKEEEPWEPRLKG